MAGRTIDSLIRGAAAGAAGTAVMTVMRTQVAPRVMPAETMPEEFTPKKAVQWAEQRLGEPNALSEAQEEKAAMAAHFGYGSGAGAAYALLRESVLRKLPPPLAGMLFGAGLWAISFEGWMPALGVQEATTEKPPRKWPAPVMMHLLYGVSTALALEALDRASH